MEVRDFLKPNSEDAFAVYLRKQSLYISLFVTMILCIFGCGPKLPDLVEVAYNDLPDQLDFNIHVKPILSDKCFSCHGPDQAKLQAGLRLDEEKSATTVLPNSSGNIAIVSGSLKSSEVYHRIISEDPDYMMPTPESNLALTTQEKAIIIKWIEDGAEYKPHWAFQKPIKSELPKVKNVNWTSNSIDNFILKRIEAEGLEPAARAEKETLLRRLSFDLTGLPPSAEEIDHFVNDQSLDAFEKQVDRLLASPHYGEKMAIDWMDLARYSDTHGYQVDYYRDVSPWRDWVIQSFNENMSYDQFITWQLAGDLLPNASREQILATTFNRLHPQNLEGGIVDEEYRVEYVADRTSVVGTGIMGMSLACAKCHDHKFDPISQKNFYEMFSFFNNVNESGQLSWDNSTPVPAMLMPDEQEEEIIEFLNSLVDEKLETVQVKETEAKDAAVAWIEQEGYKSIKKTIPTRGLQGYFDLDNNLQNKVNRRQVGKMDRQNSPKEVPVYAEGYRDRGLQLDGDAWLGLDGVGVFQRKDAFSVGLWVKLPEDLEEGVIFHKCSGGKIYNYKGYLLQLKDNKLQMVLAHTHPDNAIIKTSLVDAPKDEWVHLMMTYDGSSKASGVKLFINGQEANTETSVDNLYKDIVFFNIIESAVNLPPEPSLQVGARWRGTGIRGAHVDEVIVYGAQLSALEVLQIVDPESIETIISRDHEQLSASQKELLYEYYVHNLSSSYDVASENLREARSVLFDTIEQVKELMVMKEMKEPRQAYILERGLYDNHGEEVFPNTPESILPWKLEYPKNRLGLAKWLTDPAHPLTARVAVNRYWQNFFGRGIVASTEDFGNQGSLPTHPELLDWLAIEFIDSGWDVKALHKLIVMSSTYKQSSKASEELVRVDSENKFLARGPKVRLSSEMMRDNALAASGLLNKEIGGESVKPYQPDGLWSMNSGRYERDKGDKLYRRSLYSIWKRTVPNPTLYTFDQPDREVCTVRRQRTNTPLQALVLLNDPTYLEACKVIGERINKEGATPSSIANAYKRITGTDVDHEQLRLLVDLQKKEYEIFRKDSKKKKGWIEAGDFEIDRSLDTDMTAANAIVASVILNSDASITKR